MRSRPDRRYKGLPSSGAFRTIGRHAELRRLPAGRSRTDAAQSDLKNRWTRLLTCSCVERFPPREGAQPFHRGLDKVRISREKLLERLLHQLVPGPAIAHGKLDKVSFLAPRIPRTVGRDKPRPNLRKRVTSAHTMRANQLRLWFASMAYVLICALRRIGLKHTQFARAPCGTTRLKLLKIGAFVRTSARRIKLAMPSDFVHRAEYRAPYRPHRRLMK